MIRKIATIFASAFAMLALAVAPQIASAQAVTVQAVVPDVCAVTANTNVATTTWTGAAAEADPFNVTAHCNSAAGYQFIFTGANGEAGGGAFFAVGTATGNQVGYGVTDVAFGVNYANGVAGASVFPEATADTVTDFELTWGAQANVVADTYTDTLTVTVAPFAG